jgi:hypothetical protein
VAKISRWAIFLRVFLVTLLMGQAGRVSPASPDEENAWSTAQSLDSPAGYYRYLQFYPAGEYIEAAISALIRLGAINEPVPGRQIPSLDRWRGAEPY